MGFGAKFGEWFGGLSDGETLLDFPAIANDLAAADEKLAALNGQIATVLSLFRDTNRVLENEGI